jgi:hypothetical protein
MAGFHHLSIIVRFNSRTGTITFDGDMHVGDKIRVPQGLALLVFHLENEIPDDPGFFPINPIQWADGDRRPVQPPSPFSVRRMSDVNTTVQVVNTTLDTQEHPFFVMVQHGKSFFAKDPTIINQPPTTGGGGGGG